jgi:RNA polymerase sigma factor (TIGR02999 family)
MPPLPQYTQGPRRTAQRSPVCLTGRRRLLSVKHWSEQALPHIPPALVRGMSSPAPHGNVTALLQAWSRGERAALDELLPAVYGELRRQAERYMRRQPAGHTLQATALVHEAYLRLVDQKHVDWQSRAHFFGVAAKAMRSILVDHARARGAAKRGGGVRHLTLGSADPAGGPAPELDVEALDEALTRLAAIDPEKSRLVELRYFGGLSIEETAEVLGISPATLKRQWSTARTWLRRELTEDHS